MYVNQNDNDSGKKMAKINVYYASQYYDTDEYEH